MPATGSTRPLADGAVDGQGRLRPRAPRRPVLDEIKQGDRVFADETSLPTLAPGNGQGEERLAVGLCPRRHAPSAERSADGGLSLRGQPGRRLRRAASRGYRGILQVDGYAAYKRLAKPGRKTARRPWRGAGPISGASSTNCMSPETRRIATTTVERWRRSGSSRRMSAARSDERAKRARSCSAPIVAELFDALGTRTAAHLGQVQAGRGDPLRHRPPRRHSSASSTTAASRSTPTSSSAPSGRRPSPARTLCSPDPTVAAEPGRPSPRC